MPSMYKYTGGLRGVWGVRARVRARGSALWQELSALRDGLRLSGAAMCAVSDQVQGVLQEEQGHGGVRQRQRLQDAALSPRGQDEQRCEPQQSQHTSCFISYTQQQCIIY